MEQESLHEARNFWRESNHTIEWSGIHSNPKQPHHRAERLSRYEKSYWVDFCIPTPFLQCSTLCAPLLRLLVVQSHAKIKCQCQCQCTCPRYSSSLVIIRRRTYEIIVPNLNLSDFPELQFWLCCWNVRCCSCKVGYLDLWSSTCIDILLRKVLVWSNDVT